MKRERGRCERDERDERGEKREMREREGGGTRLARGDEEKKNEVGEGRRGEKNKPGSPSAMAPFSC